MIATEAKYSKGIQLNKRFLLSYFVHLDRTGNDDVKRRPEMGCSKIGRLCVPRRAGCPRGLSEVGSAVCPSFALFAASIDVSFVFTLCLVTLSCL